MKYFEKKGWSSTSTDLLGLWPELEAAGDPNADIVAADDEINHCKIPNDTSN